MVIKLKKKKSPFKRIQPGQHDIHKPMINPPKRLRSTPKLTIKQLFNRVDATKRENAKEIAIKAMRTMNQPKTSKLLDPATIIYRIQTYSKHNKHIHNTTIFNIEGQNPTLDSKVMVDCSCSSHIFQCEYNLAKRGNAFLWRSNGHAPTVNTNLTICKHVYVALRYMLRKAKYEVLPRKSRNPKKLAFGRG